MLYLLTLSIINTLNFFYGRWYRNIFIYPHPLIPQKIGGSIYLLQTPPNQNLCGGMVNIFLQTLPHQNILCVWGVVNIFLQTPTPQSKHFLCMCVCGRGGSQYIFIDPHLIKTFLCVGGGQYILQMPFPIKTFVWGVVYIFFMGPHLPSKHFFVCRGWSIYFYRCPPHQNTFVQGGYIFSSIKNQ